MSAPNDSTEIAAVGLVTPVGLYSESAAAAVRAGRSRARRTAVLDIAFAGQAMHLVDEEYLEPLNPSINPAGMSPAHVRMLRLGGAALAEAASASPEPAPLLLALPERRSDVADPVRPTFIGDLTKQAGVVVAERQSALYRQGAAAVLFALRDARLLLASGKASHVIVGGVDTFLDLARSAVLAAEGRLYGRSARLGFMPGEGAGFLLLRAGTPGGRSRRSPTLARLIAVGTGVEEGHRYSSKPYRGDGLANAFESLFEAVPKGAPKVRCVYAGFNGEDTPVKEWATARLRNSERFADEIQVEHPADCIGDSGAALGAIMLGLAAMAISQGHSPEPRPIWAADDPGPCLVWATSVREPRAAALLQW